MTGLLQEWGIITVRPQIRLWGGTLSACSAITPALFEQCACRKSVSVNEGSAPDEGPWIIDGHATRGMQLTMGLGVARNTTRRYHPPSAPILALGWQPCFMFYTPSHTIHEKWGNIDLVTFLRFILVDGATVCFQILTAPKDWQVIPPLWAVRYSSKISQSSLQSWCLLARSTTWIPAQ